MKRVLKIVIPLVVVLALLGGCAWFFLAYRSDLTAHFLTGQAERMMEAGRYNRAIQYETWAWKLAPDDEEIPLSLARAYAASGNYTKAEYTLVNAIAATPKNVALYVELCQVYVAQDKLLDAVQMLDRVQDETVREELAAMRPAAPELSPEDGYYTEYIEVSADGGGNDVGRLEGTHGGAAPHADVRLVAEQGKGAGIAGPQRADARAREPAVEIRACGRGRLRRSVPNENQHLDHVSPVPRVRWNHRNPSIAIRRSPNRRLGERRGALPLGPYISSQT